MAEYPTTSESTVEQKDPAESGIILAKIALDGCCRTGKGEQLRALHSYFTSRGVPAMVLRGAGTRRGAGEDWYDLGSRYWTHRYNYHSGLHTPYAERDIDDFTLARENRVWLRSLEDMGRISQSRFSVAIFDRSIISRATLALQREGMHEGRLTEDQMWPPHFQTPGEEITYDETQPDVLFNLIAPRDVLAARISLDDPNRAFRLRAVYEFYDYFDRAKDALPDGTTTRIIDLDGEAPIREVTGVILGYLGEMYPDISQQDIGSLTSAP